MAPCLASCLEARGGALNEKHRCPFILRRAPVVDDYTPLHRNISALSPLPPKTTYS
ncbi:hypothetical protein PSAC2689_10721 [Paraburkholderia sacchari]